MGQLFKIMLALSLLVLIILWNNASKESKTYWKNIGPHVNETLNPTKYEEDK